MTTPLTNNPIAVWHNGSGMVLLLDTPEGHARLTQMLALPTEVINQVLNDLCDDAEMMEAKGKDGNIGHTWMWCGSLHPAVEHVPPFVVHNLVAREAATA